MSEQRGMMSAMTFALKAHDGQLYGAQPYRAHLEAVVKVLSDFGYDREWLDAGWLHDTLEDTTATRSQLDRIFGSWVRHTVEACTGVGENRKARNACIYGRIAAFPDAAIVKVADRIANVEASNPRGSHRQMYCKEAQAFQLHVANYAPMPMQDRLSAAYTKGVDA